MPNNYVLLETIALTQSAASVTFDNLPTSGYTDLKIVMSARSTSSSGNWDPVLYRFNASTSGYSTKEVFGTGTSTGSVSSTTITSTPAGGTWGRIQDYGITTANQTANTFSNAEFYIPNFLSGNAKSGSFDSVYETNATAAYAELIATLWTGTAAITNIAFALKDGSYVAGSTFSLYGVAAYGTTPVLAPKATGGNIVANDGTYWYHAFTSSGYFVPQVGLTADVLVIAGGGGGGWERGGGGGAGGLQAFTSQALTATGYTCTIGAGGTGGTGYGSGMTAGADSQFGTLTLVKGGGYGGSGGNVGTSTGGAGGSSGGSGYYSQTSTAALGSQGTAGGASSTSGAAGGGGGGASVAGSKAVSPNGGAGGNGTSAYSSWGSATSTGQNSSGTYYYAGGGAGGCDTAGPVSGGLGGGGGSTQAASTAGTANTGGGGGAGSFGVSQYAGAAGGSGIIIVRYPIN